MDKGLRIPTAMMLCLGCAVFGCQTAVQHTVVRSNDNVSSTDLDEVVTLKPDFTGGGTLAFALQRRHELDGEYCRQYEGKLRIKDVKAVQCYIKLSPAYTALESEAKWWLGTSIAEMRADGKVFPSNTAVPNAAELINALLEVWVKGLGSATWEECSEVLADSNLAQVSMLASLHVDLAPEREEWWPSFGRIDLAVVESRAVESAGIRKWGKLRCCMLSNRSARYVLVWTSKDSQELLRSYKQILDLCITD